MSNGQVWIHSAGDYRVAKHEGGAVSVFKIANHQPRHVHTFRMRDGFNVKRAVSLVNRRLQAEEKEATP